MTFFGTLNTIKMDSAVCSHLLDQKNPSRLLEKALALMEHQLTKDDVSRHQKTIKEYLYISREGFVSFPLDVLK